MFSTPWHLVVWYKFYYHFGGADRLESELSETQREYILSRLYKTLSDIYLQSQLRVFIDVFSPISQHVSAPPGHPQVNHNIQLYYLKKAIVIPTDPLFLILQMVSV
jgi:hypothetical protein